MSGGLREEAVCAGPVVQGWCLASFSQSRLKTLTFGQSSLLDVAEIIQTTLSLGS